jgi:hypothetical protein
LKTIIQLLIAALLVNACVRGGAAAWRYYTFKDAVEQEARFGGKTTASELQQRIVDLAADYEITLDPADVEVTRDGQTTSVTAAYIEPIELVPRLYVRQHIFEFAVSVRPTRPLTADDIR